MKTKNQSTKQSKLAGLRATYESASLTNLKNIRGGLQSRSKLQCPSFPCGDQ